VNGIGRLASQFLAAQEAAGVTAGPKPGAASGAHMSENPPAEFAGHLAGFVQREAEAKVLDENTGDAGSFAPAKARQVFSPAAKLADTTTHSAAISLLYLSEAEPRELVMPSAVMTSSRPGSNVPVAQADVLSVGGIPPTFCQLDSERGPKPGVQLGAGVAMSSAQGLPASFEKPIGKPNSLNDSLSHSSANGAVLATLRSHMSTRTSRETEDSAPDLRQLVPGNDSVPVLYANETSLAGVLPGAFSRVSPPDLALAAAGGDGSPVDLAAGQTPATEGAGSNRVGSERLDFEKSSFFAPNWDRDPDIISAVPVRVRAVAQETHLALAKELSPGGQIMALRQLSSLAGEAGSSTVLGENLPQTANFGVEAGYAQTGGNHPANIPVEAKGSHDFGGLSPVQLSALAGNERGELISSAELAPAGNIAASTALSMRGSSSGEVGGSTVLGKNRPLPANQGADAAAAQLRGDYLASVPAEPRGASETGEISPLRVSASAVDEPGHPVSASLLAPAIQIAKSIAADFGGSDPETMGTQPESAILTADKTAASASRVQILHLQLEPENLGKVTVKMRLTGPKLELQVEAERPETGRLIGNDKDLLSSKLQSAGYAIDTLVIRTADLPAPPPGLAAGTGAGQEQYGGHTNQGPTAHDRSSMRDDNSPSRPILEDDAKDTHRIRATDGELYL
jgi:hypothetical protein